MIDLDPSTVEHLTRTGVFVALVVIGVRLRPWRWLASLLRGRHG